MNAIEAHDVSVTKGKQTILRKLNFALQSGTITGLIGPSGSGKTTLLRSIVGVQKYNGALTVLDEAAGSRLLRSRLGYVTQSPAVYVDLTVKQNLRYFARVVGTALSQVDSLIATVGLKEHADQLVGTLSGGQRARVSLAVALLGDPELLILDEPTVGLDPILRNELWDQFAGLARAGKTLIISSHVMDEADRCDNLLLVRDGAVLWNDTKEKLLKQTHTDNVGDAFIATIKDAA